MSRSGTIYDSLIHDRFTFKPANDLEWLAVNVDASQLDNLSGYYARCGGVAIRCRETRGAIPAADVIDKRNELFGVVIDDVTKFVDEIKANRIEDKPVKTKVEYVEIDSEEAAYYFTEYDGGVYVDGGIDDWHTVDLQGYIDYLSSGESIIYRKVETPVTWQEDVNKLLDHRVTSPLYQVMDNCQDEFIEMCRKVVSHVGMKDEG